MRWKATIEHEGCDNSLQDATTDKFDSKDRARTWASRRVSDHARYFSDDNERIVVTITKECEHHRSSYPTVRARWIAAAREYLEAVGPLVPVGVDGVDLFAPYAAVRSALDKFETCRTCGEKL